ncbi:universal stress protein [uncultured Rhodoblastus sp.]|uniref:universal stress protein n=1 Tax=uncultured Rhodoblastus sp. TaxID=543037 RepID=UPI0025FF9DA8|nr:universal stress protein [uncultured Rhodoblastus sp.]
MALCNLLVHLTGDEKSDIRLRFAVDLARSRGAQLTGLFARIAAPHAVGLVNEWPSADYSAAAAANALAFAAATQGIKAEWRDLNRGDEAEFLPQFVDFSRHFDLIVLGQPRGDDPLTPVALAEEAIVQSGRPVLVLPFAGQFDRVGTRPIFGWSDSRSSARGFYDGMTLALDGAEALVVGLSTPGDDQAIAYQKESLRLAAAHLASHGIAARPEQLALSEIGLMDALLNLAADHGADLLSMGGFGGWRYPLFARGSGSRYMLKHMTLPVLFSH